jgi:3-oxoacyl-[acyl-carrier protein] reductase
MAALQGKTALVTGASRGIGRATASALAEAGAHVLVHYGRSVQEAESLVATIQAKGGSANAISADLGTPNGAALLAGQVRSIVGDRLDVLVLNAGISKAARIADYTVEDFDNLFATNVRSPFFLVQQLLPVFCEGSNITVISSATARTVAGKPGLENLSVLAYEAGREVAPEMQALKRIGKPEDIADVVAFVASDGALWITGASIPVDGGSKL